MVPANVSVFMADKTPEMASASIYVPRGNFGCLLLLHPPLLCGYAVNLGLVWGVEG